MSPIIWLKTIMASENEDELSVAWDAACENGLAFEKTYDWFSKDCNKRVAVPFADKSITYVILDLNQNETLKTYAHRFINILMMEHYTEDDRNWHYRHEIALNRHPHIVMK